MSRSLALNIVVVFLLLILKKKCVEITECGNLLNLLNGLKNSNKKETNDVIQSFSFSLYRRLNETQLNKVET